MDMYEQIEYRKTLISNISKGKKLSPEERQWLVTNPVYNCKLGPPYTNYEIVELPSKAKYTLVIGIKQITYKNRIVPIISVPSSKGRIICDFPVTSLDGKTSLKKPVKMLGLENTVVNGETHIDYQSKLGLLAVEYQCDYFDENQNIYIRKSSSLGDFNFAMFKEYIEHNKILFHCKDPKKDNFDALVFSIEWLSQSGDCSVIENSSDD